MECPVLVDLSHGTIRHRHEEIVKNDENSKQVKIGYFYHPRLNDFSEGNLNFFYGFRGQPREKWPFFFYVKQKITRKCQLI